MAESFSSLSENKKVQRLFRLSPTTVASVKCLRLNSGRNIVLFATGNHLLHIVENRKINCIVDVGSCVLKILNHVSERDEIWIVTKDGKLLAISIPLHQENKQVKQEADEEIFKELLDDNNHMSLASDNHFTATASLFPDVCKCSDDWLVHWEPGLFDVAIDLHHVIICSSNDDNVRLTVYPWIKQNVTKRCIASNFIQQTLLASDTYNHTKKNITTLLYLSPSTEQQSSMNTNCTLKNHLFSMLFSSSQSDCSIPVVVIGLQNGFVGHIAVGMKNSNLETLYHLEQPIIAIFPVCLKPPLQKGAGDALMIFGSLGKLVLITKEDSNGIPDGVLIREYYVPGPIVCTAMNWELNALFYSTSKKIYAVKFEIETRENNKDNTNSTSSLPSSLSPIALHIPKVLALTLDEENCLICLKAEGWVLLVSKPLDTVKSKFSSPSGGQIKKHLGEIQQKADQVNKLFTEIHQLDDTIKELNKVTHIVQEILRNCNSTFQETGISFTVGVDYESLGTDLNPNVILRCYLRNSTKFSFSPNWSLVIQVRTTQPWYNKDCSIHSTTNHSVSLSTDSVHHVSIPMEDSFTFLFPIQVSCYVCFRLKDLLQTFPKESEFSLCEEGFSVLVSQTHLDILHFLRRQLAPPGSYLQQHRFPTRLLQNTLKDLNSTWKPNELPDDHSKQTSEFSSFSMHLSKDAVDFIEKKVLHFNSSETTADSCDKPNQEESNMKPNVDAISKKSCLLRFMLHDSRRHVYSSDMNYPEGHMVARTPSEEVIKFQVVKFDGVASPESMEGQGLDLHVHTSSQELGCSVHSALMKVFEPVLQRTSGQNASIPVVELQKQLIKLKELQTSLDLLRPPCGSEQSLENNNSHNRTIHKLISIYCDLRSISTTVP
ncbi:uncharacterized protein LOC114536774 [Dendronephthya gigantea]|uniref:uncharacterized protein LOC114536774 n=1 Tax=Dendronephthya gigantea TaxID=151771 RepID=UPI00106D577D|nr:uncharacterized protein LOC114536774 [Dendronephthya gigantea]